MEAGKDFAAFIKSLAVVPPHRMSIISHSHGGIVALYALRHAGTENIEGIAFLATPFLEFAPQGLDLVAFKALPRALEFMTFIISVSLFVTLGIRFLGPMLRANQYAAYIVLIATVSLGALVTFFARRAIRALSSKDDERFAGLHKVCESYQPTVPQRTRVLILRKAGDEASALIDSGRVIEFVVTIVWRIFSWLIGLPAAIKTAAITAASNAFTVFVAFVERHATQDFLDTITAFRKRHPWMYHGLILVVLALLFIALPIALFATLWGLHGFWEPIITYSFLGFAVAVILVSLIQALLFCSLIVLNILRFGLGAGLSESSIIRVTSEATPLGGPWMVERFPTSGFAHSEIHEDPLVADRIIRWLFEECPKDNEAGD